MTLPKPVGRQRDVVYLTTSGHQVVLGTAGTGKTVMAIHRAAHLADPRTANHGPTLLITYTNSLVSYLRHYLAARPNLAVETYGLFGRGYLYSLGKMGFNQIVEPDRRRSLVAGAVAAIAANRQPPLRFLERETDFFIDELDWIEANGLTTLDNYLEAERVGRMAPLRETSRRAVWEVRARYMARRSEAGYPYDWASIPRHVLAELGSDPRPRMYKHIVVDEAQDLSPEAIRSLAAAIPLDGSLTLFADYAQQLYGQRISWRSCGLKVSRPELFVDNYRNSPEISRLAIALSEMPHFNDSADLVEPKVVARAAGAKPTLAGRNSTDDEAHLVAQAAAESGKSARVGILTRTRREARLASRGIAAVTMLHDNIRRWDVSNGVYAGTYHSAKGLEFDVVYMPFCGAGRCPDPDTVAAFGEEEANRRDSRLLYVGITRAKSELVITYTGQLTPLLPPPTSGLYEVAS